MQPIDWIFVKRNGSLPFATNMSKNIGKKKLKI